MSWTQFLAKIPRQQFIVKLSRSSGPGGQNVNKVNTKATIRLPRASLESAEWLPVDVRDKLLSPEFAYSTKRGDILVSSELTRSQAHNINDCFVKLAREIAKEAFTPADPSTEAKARWARLSQREEQRRKEMKKRHASKKQDRRV